MKLSFSRIFLNDAQTYCYICKRNRSLFSYFKLLKYHLDEFRLTKWIFYYAFLYEVLSDNTKNICYQQKLFVLSKNSINRFGDIRSNMRFSVIENKHYAVLKLRFCYHSSSTLKGMTILKTFLSHSLPLPPLLSYCFFLPPPSLPTPEKLVTTHSYFNGAYSAQLRTQIKKSFFEAERRGERRRGRGGGSTSAKFLERRVWCRVPLPRKCELTWSKKNFSVPHLTC